MALKETRPSPGGLPRVLGVTPVTDRIRARFSIASAINSALLEHVLGQPFHNPSEGMCSPPVFFGNSKLPAFAESEIEDPELLASAAAEVFRMRRARDLLMPTGLMGEPAWDILLALYIEGPDGLTRPSLCYGSGVPQPTALRWLSVLEAEKMILRTLHPRDEKLGMISLSDFGRTILERSLKAMLRSAGD